MVRSSWSPVRGPIFILSFLLLCLSLLYGDALAWNELPLEHFTVYYPPGRERLADEVGKAAEDNYKRLVRSLGLRRDSFRGRIFLPASGEDFASITGGAVPNWGGGVAFPQHRAIVLRPSSGEDQKLSTVVAHEVCHLIVWDVAGGIHIPRWFDEGVAMWGAMEWGRAQSWRLVQAVIFNRLIPLDRIDDVLSFRSGRADLAYAESFSAVMYLFKIGGRDVLREILRELHLERDFEVAFVRTVGIRTTDFEKEWKEYVGRNYNLILFIGSWPGISMLMVFLFLLAYFVKRRRSKRIIREWEEEGDW